MAPVLAEEWVRWSWVVDHLDDIGAALREHVALTAAAVVVGALIAVPLGVLATRRRRLLGPLLAVTGVLYSIPSLALFALLAPITGYLSHTTALIALVAYTLLILIRNVVAGLDAVPAEITEAATGMGYGSLRRLLRVELPLAAPAILAGVRIATVSTVGLVTVAFVLGRGGLGDLIYEGLRRDFRTPTVVGSVLSVALALVADLGLVLLQRVVTPWSRRAG
jgi:osmoprotectant transport system permease protein